MYSNMTSATQSQMGRVKWFNTKSGFGFITVISSGSHLDEDIFAHHSSVTVSDEQYKYLIQGEYVEFELEAAAAGGSHKFQAKKVTGIYGGKLMCETRNEFRQSRNIYKGEEETAHFAPSSFGELTTTPATTDSSGGEWKLANRSSVETHIRSIANTSSNAGRGRGRSRKVTTSTVDL